MVRRYSKEKRSKSFIKIYCLVFILALSSIGVGYGVLSDGVQLVGIVHTGNIDSIFLEDIQVDIQGQGQVATYLKGEHTIVVSVQNAHVDDIYRIRYEIANNGSIPVSFKAATSESDPEIQLRLQNPTRIIEGYGDATEGEITIAVGEVLPDSTYECSVSFAISQWDTID